MAIVVDGDIWVYDLAGRPPTKVTSDGTADMLLWSRDGTGIIYESTRAPVRLYWVRINADLVGSPVPASPHGHFHPHGWLPDGETLMTVLNTYSASGWDILALAPRADAVPAPLVHTPSDDGMFGAALSPDSQWLAYSSNVTGGHEIWVRPVSGSAAPVRVSARGGVDPQWSRHGHELYFVENGTRLMAVTVQPGSGFNFASPRLLFESRYPYAAGQRSNLHYDVAADGRFVVIRPAPAAAPAPITVVVNWASDLAN